MENNISYSIRRSRKDYLKYKNQALELAIGRVNFFNTIYKVSFNKINIRNQKTRWGSCSTRGNLNFNYKILFLSERARDYIIVHEICHLKQFNHSKNFWSLVGLGMPDYIEIRKELKKNYLRVQWAYIYSTIKQYANHSDHFWRDGRFDG